MLVFNCGPLMRQKPAEASTPLNAIIHNYRNHRGWKSTALVLRPRDSCHIRGQRFSLDNSLHLMLPFKNKTKPNTQVTEIRE